MEAERREGQVQWGEGEGVEEKGERWEKDEREKEK